MVDVFIQTDAPVIGLDTTAVYNPPSFHIDLNRSTTQFSKENDVFILPGKPGRPWYVSC